MLTAIIVGVAISLLGLVSYLISLATKQKRNIGQLKQDLTQFQSIIDIETEHERIRSSFEQEQEQTHQIIKDLNLRQSNITSEISDAEGKLTALKEEITLLEDIVDIQSFGLYQPKYDFGTADEYKERLDDIREKQKAMIRQKVAIVCPTEWTIDGNKTKGRQMTDRQIKLMARAFNGECDSIIPRVRYNNFDRIEKRIESAYEAINKLGEPNHCSIEFDYLSLKYEELHLVHEYQEKLQAEREEQRRIREQIRDEQRAQRELEKAQQEAEKEEGRYQKALDKARQEIEEATGEKHNKLQSEIGRLNELLLEAQANKERAMSRSEMTKSGHVYVISNIGSFGENIYKIGMTRRLEPTDRVRELGDASVPFRFDIHAMIYSEDAPTLENEIHRILEKRSVNRVNTRKEFFNVSLEEIENIVQKHDVNAEFIHVPTAEEFRKTQRIIAEEMPTE